VTTSQPTSLSAPSTSPSAAGDAPAEIRRAVVTGASSGIGAATVRRLRALGWDVVAFARRADLLDALASETGAHPVVGDVTDDDDVARLVREAEARGPVHAVLNIAGFASGTDPIDASDVDRWRAMFETNVLGTVRVTKAFLPAIRRAGFGTVLVLTSTAGHDAYSGGSGYVATKHAQAAVVDTLRLELNGEPIRVLEIAPGMVRTEGFSLTRFDGDQARADAVYEGVQDPLTADDVADVVTFAVTRPQHVAIDTLVLRPVAQSSTTLLARGPLVTRTERA